MLQHSLYDISDAECFCLDCAEIASMPQVVCAILDIPTDATAGCSSAKD